MLKGMGCKSMYTVMTCTSRTRTLVALSTRGWRAAGNSTRMSSRQSLSEQESYTRWASMQTASLKYSLQSYSGTHSFSAIVSPPLGVLLPIIRSPKDLVPSAWALKTRTPL